MKVKGKIVSALLVIDTFFVSYAVGFNSRHVLIIDPAMPPYVQPASASVPSPVFTKAAASAQSKTSSSAKSSSNGSAATSSNAAAAHSKVVVKHEHKTAHNNKSTHKTATKPVEK